MAIDGKGAIGIDLGTTNCVVSYINEEGEVDCVPNLDGDFITPTFIHFNIDGGRIRTVVGKKAKALAKTDPDNVVSSFKTAMGTSKIIKSIFDKNITSLECSEIMLKYLKFSAEKYLNTTITNAVISVPAYFSEQQKEATKVAAKRAGLNVKRILTEPTAGSFYYGINSAVKEKVVAVYDLGGGTFDISLISILDDTSTVLGAPKGDSKLGGDDIDRAIAQYVLKVCNVKKLSRDDEEKLIRLCEDAKIRLCEQITRGKYSAPVNIEAESIGLKTVTLSKEQFEQMVDPLVQRTLSCFEMALTEAGLTVEDLDEVILVGGSSRIPYIRECLEKFLNDERFTVDYFKTYAVDPDLAVGLGCGIYLKYILENKERAITDVISKTIGVEIENGIFEPLITKGRAIPARKTKMFTNASDNQTVVACNIYEGEDKIVTNNTFLGKVNIPIMQGPKNTINVLVRASVTEDGVLSVYVVSGGDSGELVINRQFDSSSDNWGNVSLESGDEVKSDSHGVSKW